MNDQRKKEILEALQNGEDLRGILTFNEEEIVDDYAKDHELYLLTDIDNGDYEGVGVPDWHDNIRRGYDEIVARIDGHMNIDIANGYHLPSPINDNLALFTIIFQGEVELTVDSVLRTLDFEINEIPIEYEDKYYYVPLNLILVYNIHKNSLWNLIERQLDDDMSFIEEGEDTETKLKNTVDDVLDQVKKLYTSDEAESYYLEHNNQVLEELRNDMYAYIKRVYLQAG